ncbi:unnamed protein product [Thlaspi arvense]|uniref:Reverse transcriptase zinc-binding domain-containing protein n=1 Tax=Thlaspi arvense TaxID=13288 RepID=A0AAU9S9F2_THLAR|nr:unnamed protein product [Thlaspi arvense]
MRTLYDVFAGTKERCSSLTSRLIWLPKAVSRYSFISWLAISNRLATGVKMRTYGIKKYLLQCKELGFWAQVIHNNYEDTFYYLNTPRRNVHYLILLTLFFQSSINRIWHKKN